MTTLPGHQRSVGARIAPAMVLMVLPPALTEWLLGGTRLSAIVGFPLIVFMEIAVWGGGALMLRGLARKLGLGWPSLLLFGLAIAVAEEFVIQQTSFAPLVIKLKGVEWGRAAGINYVYAIWALVYEAVWVMLVPTALAEMLFPSRRDDTWISRAGLVTAALLFSIGSVMAWYGWTRIARVNTFHLPVVDPTPAQFASGIVAALALLAAGCKLSWKPRPRKTPPAPALIGILAAIWALLWYALMLAAFGIAPQLQAPIIALAALATVFILGIPVAHWVEHPAWGASHRRALVSAALLAAMAVSFFGFQGGSWSDIGFKALTNIVATVLLLRLGSKAGNSTRLPPPTSKMPGSSA